MSALFVRMSMRTSPGSWRPSSVLATACLLVLAVPVLAYIGRHVWQAIQESELLREEAVVGSIGSDASAPVAKTSDS